MAMQKNAQTKEGLSTSRRGIQHGAGGVARHPMQSYVHDEAKHTTSPSHPIADLHKEEYKCSAHGRGGKTT